MEVEVEVETLEEGLRIEIRREKKSPGLLVSILEAFEEVGMEVRNATVSCSDSFHLEALGAHNNERGTMGRLDGESLKQAVILAVENWKDNNECDQNNDQEDHNP